MVGFLIQWHKEINELITVVNELILQGGGMTDMEI